MLERLARGMTKTAAPKPWSQWWLHRQPAPDLKHMGVGAVLGAGAGALSGAIGDEGVNAPEIGVGALLGALAGRGWRRGVESTVEGLVAKERELDNARDFLERGHNLFGGKTKARKMIPELEHEIYNLGLREYLKKGLEGAAAPLTAGAGYVGGKAVGTHETSEED